MRSTLESAPKKESGTGNAPTNAVRATVAGLDESGRMFRDTVSIVALDGCNCIFLAKSKPELNSWVLVEILPSKSGEKAISVQGQVMTLEPEGQAEDQYRIRVELETKQSLKIGDISQELKPATTAPLPIPAPGSAPVVATKPPLAPAITLVPASTSAPSLASGPARIPAPPAAAATPGAGKANPLQPGKDTLVKDSAPNFAPSSLLNKTKADSGAGLAQTAINTQPQKATILPAPGFQAPKTIAVPPPLDKEAISAAVAHEIKQQLAAAKAGLNENLEMMVRGAVAQEVKQQAAAKAGVQEDLEKTVQRIVAVELKQQFFAAQASLKEDLEKTIQRSIATGLEPTIQQILDKKLSANFQSAIQTINDDLKFQLAGHVAKNEELRGTVESLARQSAAAQIAEWQKTSGGNLAAAESLQSLEKSVAEIQARLKGAQDNASATVGQLEAMNRQILDSAARLQKIVDQMNLGARATIEKFDAHIAEQLASWSEHIQNYADGVAQEKVAIFTSGLEHQVSSHMTDANQMLERLSEGVRQAQDVVRTQEIQLEERYQSIISHLEKEIRATLLKIAGSS